MIIDNRMGQAEEQQEIAATGRRRTIRRQRSDDAVYCCKNSSRAWKWLRHKRELIQVVESEVYRVAERASSGQWCRCA